MPSIPTAALFVTLAGAIFLTTPLAQADWTLREEIGNPQTTFSTFDRLSFETERQCLDAARIVAIMLDAVPNGHTLTTPDESVQVVMIEEIFYILRCVPSLAKSE